jgi:hypothetical protein
VAPEPCSVDYCATGTVAGYGEATLSGTVTGFTPVQGPFSFCALITSSNTITLADGSTLAITASGINCFAGNSNNAPGSLVSYGNPHSGTGTYTVTGGTGVFAGAAGSGDFSLYEAGDVEVFNCPGLVAMV